MGRQEVVVVIVPFPAHGHLNQLLHFSLHLSARSLPVHFACTATHNRQAQTRIQGWDHAAVKNIRFHDLHIPDFSTPPPNPDAIVKFPAHLQSMFDASDHLQLPLLDLFRSLSAACDRLVVVHDPLMAFAGLDAVTLPNAEVYRYQCLSAFFLLSFFHREDLCRIPKEEVSESMELLLKPLDGLLTDEFTAFVVRRWEENPLESGTVINTCRPIENEFIELLAKQPSYRNKKLFAIGPVNPVAPAKEGRGRHECLEWLDKQPVDSVVYISFGTTSTISDEQIKQLAVGLQRCGQRFIWVLRDADLADISVNGKEHRQRRLPENFELETKGIGLVVRGWAPQLEILAHRSTGAFMSHCGWNSCMESLSLGVPIIAWPMHSDQPGNAIMVTEYLKTGVKVREWDQRKEVESAAEVEKAIKRVMVFDEGKELRKRSQSMGEAVRLAVMDGGSSHADLGAFVEHITRS